MESDNNDEEWSSVLLIIKRSYLVHRKGRCLLIEMFFFCSDNVISKQESPLEGVWRCVCGLLMHFLSRFI